MPKVDPSFESTSSDKMKVDKTAPIEDQAKAEWQNDPKLRSEFGNDYEAFLAFKKANENNQVKILKR